ncbi:MAG TPA: polysaccharide deacetylase family protein [Solirubrobacterales bacterium]|nr:polysaccharide deacetylase family protein [Solirubrobacterales bacterium]
MGDLLVLCYHGVSETWPAATSVRPGDFEEQLRHFSRRGYVGATLTTALTAPPAERTLVVSFDDAHRSVLEQAAPIMERLGIPGTVFVPTDYAGGDAPMAWSGYDEWLGTEHEGELLCLGWGELGGLAATGWEVGSHTCSHPRLSQLDDEQIARELRESKQICEERLGVPCRSLAYPYSDYDDRAVAAALEAGYSYAVTVPRRPTAPLPLQWPRVGAYQGESARRIALRARSRRLGASTAMRAALKLRDLGR